MSDPWETWIEIEPGLVASEDGELADPAPANVRRVLQLYYDAVQQRKEWEKVAGLYGAIVLKEIKRSGDMPLTVSILDATGAEQELVTRRGNNGDRKNTDVAAFVEAVMEMPLELEDLFQVLSAASGFKEDRLPVVRPTDNHPEGIVREAFEQHTERKPTADFVRQSIAKKRAPKARVVPDPELVEA